MLMNHKLILTVLGGLVLGILGGWYFGSQAGFRNGQKAASDMLVAAGILQSAPHGLTSISGVVLHVDVEKKLLTVRVLQTISNPLAEQAPTERTVQITADTTLLRQKQKTQRDYDRELVAIQKQWERSPAAVVPSEPKRFVESPIYISDLTPNATVSIESNTDILYAGTFVASRIILVEP